MGVTQTYSIGRDANADIPIADESVSRLHAQVAIVGPDELFLSDCGSTNGTWRLHGSTSEAIQQARVHAHETVKFGSVEIHARDLIEAVAARQRHAAQSRQAPSPPQQNRRNGAMPLAHSERLVRCGCGAVRTAREQCVLCGEI